MVQKVIHYYNITLVDQTNNKHFINFTLMHVERPRDLVESPKLIGPTHVLW